MKFIMLITLWIFSFQSIVKSAGKITSITGPTQISRENKKIVGAVDVIVKSMDVIETLKSKTSILFDDDSRINITEHSKLKIDSFVYDPNSESGKFELKATLGTIRYASGKIASNNRENINIQTPTAAISIRGTDFSMTVDEIGRSLVILLPGKNQEIGTIDVSTMAGFVRLDKAFQGTFVMSASVLPTPPVIFDLDEGNIGNDLLLDSPVSIDNSPSRVGDMNNQLTSNKLIENLSTEDKIIQIINDSKFVFVEEGAVSRLNNSISGNTIRITIPQSTDATLKYEYVGGTATAKSGTGVGLNITIIQR